MPFDTTGVTRGAGAAVTTTLTMSMTVYPCGNVTAAPGPWMLVVSAGRKETAGHLDKERQAAGAAAGHDGGHGWPMHDSYEAGYVLATMPAGTVAGHAGWQPACTRTGVGPERRLPRPDTGGTR